MRQKPTITRYFRNTKTGEYAGLSGSPIAVNRVINVEWPRLQKVMVQRVSRREFKANTPSTMLGHEYKYKNRHKMTFFYL
jgi:hypothetical protein